MAQALTVEEKKERALTRTTAERSTSTRKRNVFNGTEGKLTIGHTIDGQHLHIFNDSPGRVQQAIDAGYEFVKPEEVGGVKDNVVSKNTDLGEKVRYLVGREESGEPLYAYLMKIKQEWYEEDQGILQDKNDFVDDAIRHGRSAKDGKSEGFYVPKDGIKMTN